MQSGAGNAFRHTRTPRITKNNACRPACKEEQPPKHFGGCSYFRFICLPALLRRKNAAAGLRLQGRRGGVYICRMSAGRAADNVLFHDSGFVDLAVEKFVLYVLKSQPCNGIRETFAGNALVAEEQDGFFHDLDDLFFGSENAGKSAAGRHLFAPSAADVNPVSVHSLVVGVERTLCDTPTAMVAHIGIDDQLTVFDGRRMHGASLFYLAHLTTAALGEIELRHALSDNAQVVEVGFDAVVRTPAHGNLEFMRKSNFVIPLVEKLMQLFAERKGIDQTVLAGRALAGDDGTYFRARAARLQSVFVQECNSSSSLS